jgi:hypothetical protein
MFLTEPNRNREVHRRTFKRKIRFDEKNKLAKKLKADTPNNVHENLVKKFSSSVHPLVPNIAVLRNISSETKKPSRPKQNGLDEFFMLRLLNNSVEFFNVIKLLQIAPDYVNIFWTQKQDELLKFLNLFDVFFTLDASGTIVRYPTLYESKQYEIIPNKHKPVYLYLLKIHSSVSKKSVVISQMLSSNHGTDNVSRWLKLFFQKCKSKPREIRIDCSAMFMSAIAHTFNNCSTNDYLRICYNSLEKKELLNKNFTLIRLDKSHVLKIFSRWQLWAVSKCGLMIKKFYVSLLYTMIEEENFETLQNVCEHLIIVMLTKNQNYTMQKSLEYLYAYLSGKDVSQCDYVNDEKEQDESCENDDLVLEEKFWINNLFDKIYKEVTDSTNEKCSKLNVYYLPTFKNDFVRIMQISVMWTNVLRPLTSPQFDVVCTTSGLESEFNIIKHNTFVNVRLPTDSQTFLVKYLKHVDAQSIIFMDSEKTSDLPILTKELKIKLDTKPNKKRIKNCK